VEDELAAEMRFHLEQQIEENLAAGMPADEARHAALRTVGGIELLKEECRDMRRVNWIENLVQDLRYAGRTLRKSPGFTAVAVLSLGLGIGANTAIFSLVNAVMLRKLPVPEPDQVVQFIYTTSPGWNSTDWNSWFGYPQFERFRDRTQTMSGVVASVPLRRISVTARGGSELSTGEATTGNTFAVLGVNPRLGRLFSSGDDAPGTALVVLSSNYWERRFGADPAVIGERILINQVAFTVIGVIQPEFFGVTIGQSPDLWTPLRALDLFVPQPTRWTATFTSWLRIMGRLKPGIQREQAQAELDVIHRQLLAEDLAAAERRSESMQRFVQASHLQLKPAANGVTGGLRQEYELPLKLLIAVAGLVVLIACANVANLLLARASARQREVAVRLALGAGRGRVIRQLLTESLLLSGLGGVVALAIAWWGSTALLRAVSTGDAAIPVDVRPDWIVFGFAAAVSLATGVLFGIAPALRATRIDPGPAMKDNSRQTTRSSRGLDRALVVVQVALSLVLVAGAGLFVRTVVNLWTISPGWDRDNVLMFSVDASLSGYTREKRAVLQRQLLERFQTIGSVRAASVSAVRPVDDQAYFVDMIGEVDGRRLADSERIKVAFNALGPGYFATVATPLVLGRDFELRDDASTPEVVIVNESLARRAFPGENPIGHRLGKATIVGVAKDSIYGGLRGDPRPVLYRSVFQSGNSNVTYELRYSGDSASVLEAARREVAALDRNLPLFRVKTLRVQAEESLLKERLVAMLASFFGALALLLACVGLYGLMSYAVVRRTAEIGIRMALGARSPQMLWLVLRETLLLAAAGVVVGIPVVLWSARYVKSMLYGVAPTDPWTIAMAAVIMVAVTTVAGYLPARRAAGIDPMVALRQD
jgi:predicted permease